MKKITTLVAILVFSAALIVPQPTFAALSEFQINSIVLLLRAFGAPTQTVDSVRAALSGAPQTSSDEPEYVSGDPVIPNEGPGVERFEVPELPDERPGVEYFTPPQPTLSLSLAPVQITRGSSATLSWSATDVENCSLQSQVPSTRVTIERNDIRNLDATFPVDASENFGLFGATGSLTVSPQRTTVYVMTCSGLGGSVSAREMLTVNEPVSTGTQKLLINGHNTYSADVVADGSQTWLYFGGWMLSSQVHDNIYRATCNRELTQCSDIVTVLDAQKLGFEHLNDPSLVTMPGGYYIMYYTGVPSGQDGLVASNNSIYFSTSWVGDGVNWSKPQRLVEKHWLPGAVLGPDRNVYLYANDNGSHGKIVRMNMGPSGVGLLETTRVEYGTDDTHFNNIDVKYEGGAYRIVAERPTFPKSEIDVFKSADGIAWTRTGYGVLKPATGEYRIGTPAWSPYNNTTVLFGSTKRSDSTGFKIYSASIPSNVVAQRTFSDRVMESLGTALISVVGTLGSVFR